MCQQGSYVGLKMTLRRVKYNLNDICLRVEMDSGYMKIVSRDVLHEEVWIEPMTKVAERYGISDVALKKLCVKHRIPTPPRGYWAKLSAGKRVKKTHYTQIDDPYLNSVRIRGALSGVPEPVAEKFKAVASVPKAQMQEQALLLVDADKPLHKQAELLKARLEKAAPEHGGLRSVRHKTGLKASVGAASIGRVAVFAHRFFTGIEQLGYQLKATDDGLVLVVGEEILQMEIKENLDRDPHIMSEKEAAALEKWENGADRRMRTWGFSDYGRPTIPEFDYFPSGTLIFQFSEDRSHGLRRRFSDGKKQRLEDMVDRILMSAQKIAVARVAWREEQERKRAEWAEEARLRKEQERLANLELKRIEDFDNRADAWARFKKLNTYLDEVRSRRKLGSETQGLAEWIEWAEGYLANNHPFERNFPKLHQSEDFK